MMSDPWLDKLNAAEYRVLRQGATEPPGAGEYLHSKTIGTYHCRACDAELFSSETKFDSDCGWPSFWEPAKSPNVTLLTDNGLGMDRTEVRCAQCDSHLGHVFTGEGFPTPTDERYCINSISLRLHESNS